MCSSLVKRHWGDEVKSFGCFRFPLVFPHLKDLFFQFWLFKPKNKKPQLVFVFTFTNPGCFKTVFLLDPQLSTTVNSRRDAWMSRGSEVFVFFFSGTVLKLRPPFRQDGCFWNSF